MCFTSYKKLKEFAENIMKIDVYIPIDPLKTSFLKIDPVAKAELLKVRGVNCLKFPTSKFCRVVQ